MGRGGWFIGRQEERQTQSAGWEEQHSVTAERSSHSLSQQNLSNFQSKPTWNRCCASLRKALLVSSESLPACGRGGSSRAMGLMSEVAMGAGGYDKTSSERPAVLSHPPTEPSSCTSLLNRANSHPPGAAARCAPHRASLPACSARRAGCRKTAVWGAGKRGIRCGGGEEAPRHQGKCRQGNTGAARAPHKACCLDNVLGNSGPGMQSCRAAHLHQILDVENLGEEELQGRRGGRLP